MGGCHLCGITNRGLAETWPFLSVKFRINKQGTYGDVIDVLRFARILAHYPYVVLLVVFVVTATCLVVCVTIPKTLDFREPTLVSASIALSLLHSRLSVCLLWSVSVRWVVCSHWLFAVVCLGCVCPCVSLGMAVTASV